MNAPIPPLEILNFADAEAVLANIASQLRIGRIVPYLGPKLTALSTPGVPTSYEALAEFLEPRSLCRSARRAIPGPRRSILRAPNIARR